MILVAVMCIIVVLARSATIDDFAIIAFEEFSVVISNFDNDQHQIADKMVLINTGADDHWKGLDWIIVTLGGTLLLSMIIGFIAAWFGRRWAIFPLIALVVLGLTPYERGIEIVDSVARSFEFMFDMMVAWIVFWCYVFGTNK